MNHRPKTPAEWKAAKPLDMPSALANEFNTPYWHDVPVVDNDTPDGVFCTCGVCGKQYRIPRAAIVNMPPNAKLGFQWGNTARIACFDGQPRNVVIVVNLKPVEQFDICVDCSFAMAHRFVPTLLKQGGA